ncbi:MAG: sugar phosphate isomerase/epimerase family protein [Candidatus Thorarchaeota archaeon]|jgi:sugar phosphate isomerase/epimerase
MPLPSNRAYHVVYDNSLEDALNYASENDWTSIVPDIGVPRFTPEGYNQEQRSSLRDLSQELAVGWGFHAPGDDVSLSTTYAPVKTAIIHYFKRIVDFARSVSAAKTNIVVHAGIPPSLKQARMMTDDFVKAFYGDFLNTLVGNLLELLEYASPDVEIVLENHQWTPLIHDAVRSLIPEGLKLCLDIPKLYDSTGRIKDKDWTLLHEHRRAVSVVHIHDWSERYGSHQIVGEGSIDFEPPLRFLTEIASSPIQYVFEVRDRENAQQSLRNFEKLAEGLGMNLG